MCVIRVLATWKMDPKVQCLLHANANDERGMKDLPWPNRSWGLHDDFHDERRAWSTSIHSLEAFRTILGQSDASNCTIGKLLPIKVVQAGSLSRFIGSGEVKIAFSTILPSPFDPWSENATDLSHRCSMLDAALSSWFFPRLSTLEWWIWNVDCLSKGHGRGGCPPTAVSCDSRLSLGRREQSDPVRSLHWSVSRDEVAALLGLY